MKTQTQLKSSQQASQTAAHLAAILQQLNGLSGVLRPLSKTAHSANVALVDRLGLANQPLLPLCKDILSHLLHVVEHKTAITPVVNAMTRMISLVKQVAYTSKDLEAVLCHLLDIVGLLLNKHPQTSLRVIQCTYSLIDSEMVAFMPQELVVRLYQVCCQCCQGDSIVQNISLSALLALTQIVFTTTQGQNWRISDSILQGMLDFLFKNQGQSWMTRDVPRGVVYQLVNTAMSCMKEAQVRHLMLEQPEIVALLQHMYRLSIKHSFCAIEQVEPIDPLIIKEENEKCVQFRKGWMGVFLRFWKSFITLSRRLAVRGGKDEEIVPLRDQLNQFELIYELPRGLRLYLMMEGISLLLQENYITNSELGSSLNSTNGQPKIGNSPRKMWQRILRKAIKTIKYLTSLNYPQPDDQIIRKILTELQHWFVLCPSIKTRNLVIQQLLETSKHMENPTQAIRASQCVQIGSNIVMAYSEQLDNFGLTMLLRMLAGTHISWEDGKGFDELEEVCIMAEQIYSMDVLTANREIFATTLQAFVQCANGILADMQVPPQKRNSLNNKPRRSHQRHLREVSYLLQRLMMTVEKRWLWLQEHWNFLSCFWVSFCSSRESEVRHTILNHLNQVIKLVLDRRVIEQSEAISVYDELVRLNNMEVDEAILKQLTFVLLQIKDEKALMLMFKITEDINSAKHTSKLSRLLYELMEMMVKQTLFRIREEANIAKIIAQVGFFSKDKNEQYRTAQLLWTISDHLKTLSQQGHSPSEQLWKKLFERGVELAFASPHPETKQVFMHSITHMLAELTGVLRKQFIEEILGGCYMHLVGGLLGWCEGVKPREDEEGSTVMMVETCRVGVKNFIKTAKKCLAQGIKVFPILDETVSLLSEYMQTSGESIPIEYNFQLCTLLQFLFELKREEKSEYKGEGLLDLIDRIESNHQYFKKTTIMWRKYITFLNQIVNNPKPEQQ